MRGPDLQPLAAGAAALLLIASMGWWLFSAPEQVDPGQPTWKGADIVQLQAAVPEIARFDHFYVNHDNPFVPHAQRLAERGVYDPRTRPVAVPPPRPMAIPPPKPPVVVLEPEKPKLVLPKLSATTTNAPVAYGLLVSEGEEVLIARMSDSQTSVKLKPGEKIANWTLVSIDSGNLVTFLDPQGVEHRFAIGQGDLVATQDSAAGAAPGKDATGRGGTPVKGSTPGTPPTNRPPGADGPIPRPPPREERRRRERPPENAQPNQPQTAPPPKK